MIIFYFHKSAKLKTYSSFIFMFVLAVFNLDSNAQQLLGISQSNYAGTNSIFLNPANTVNEHLSVYLNFGVADIYLENTYFTWNGPFSPLKLLTGEEEYQSRYLGHEESSKSHLLNTYGEIRGPSLLVKLSPKSGFSIYSRARSAVQLNNLSADIAELIANGFDDVSTGKGYSNSSVSTNSNLFSEIGVSFGTTLFDNSQSKLKMGITIKRLYGGFSAALVTEDLDYSIVPVENPEMTESFMVIENITGTYNYSTDDMDDFDPWDDSPGSGWGFDIGFVYQRPSTKQASDKYKYKLGLALTDIGNIKYENATARSFQLKNENGVINEELSEEFSDNPVAVINEVLGLDPSLAEKSFRTGLPMAMNLQFDYYLAGKLFANLTVMQSLRKKDAVTLHQYSFIALTPRIEMKWFELSVPLSLTANYRTFSVGIGAKLGPIYLGSNNIAGLLNMGNPKGADLYVGLAIPFYKRDKEKSKKNKKAKKESKKKELNESS